MPQTSLGRVGSRLRKLYDCKLRLLSRKKEVDFWVEPRVQRVESKTMKYSLALSPSEGTANLYFAGYQNFCESMTPVCLSFVCSFDLQCLQWLPAICSTVVCWGYWGQVTCLFSSLVFRLRIICTQGLDLRNYTWVTLFTPRSDLSDEILDFELTL